MKNAVDSTVPQDFSPARGVASEARVSDPGSVLYLAAAFSMAAAMVHLWMAPERFEEWWGYGVFFLITALAQGIYGVALLRWQYRPLLLPGIGGNLVIVAFYLTTRMFGGPLFGPQAGHTAAVGGLELVGTITEVALIMTLLALLQNLYRMRVVLPGILALGVALAGLGVFLSAGVLTDGNSTEKLADSHGIAESVRTSFGVVAVEHAEKIPGLTAKKLAGMTHGVQSNVPPDKVKVEASIALTNLLDHPVGYSPDQFSLISDNGDRPISLSHSTIQDGTLQPDASIEATLSFVAPRDGSRLWVRYQDTADSRPILIDIGSTDKTPSDAFDGYHGPTPPRPGDGHDHH